jgi:DNA-binding PadR family transcriptional regulator
LKTSSEKETQNALKMNRRIVKNFLDIIIMSELRDAHLSGFDIIVFIQKKFDVNMSPGTVYATLYSLERHNLIQGTRLERKRVYQLTQTGVQTIKEMLDANVAIKSFTSTILKVH